MKPSDTAAAGRAAESDHDQSQEPGEGDEEGRSVRKRRAILGAARDLFLRQGYLGTSMDAVAGEARVSKQTVYKHFGDKRKMFIEILTGDMSSADATVATLAAALPESQDLQADLGAFARAYLATVMQPHLIRLRRLVIGEAERFPELAAAWYASGPEQAYTTFGQWFEVLNQRGLLHVEDSLMAAQHFNWLILSTPLNRAMAHPVDNRADSLEQLDRYANEGVRVFLAAYGPTRTSL